MNRLEEIICLSFGIFALNIFPSICNDYSKLGKSDKVAPNASVNMIDRPESSVVISTGAICIFLAMFIYVIKSKWPFKSPVQTGTQKPQKIGGGLIRLLLIVTIIRIIVYYAIKMRYC